MHIVVNNLMTSYEQWGNGPKTLLALHGWADRASTFASLARELAGGYTLIAVDLPGFGGSQQPLTPWHLADYANFVRDFLAKIGQAEPYAIIGHSNGGAIAVTGLANSTLRTQRLVLIASAGVRMTADQTVHRFAWQGIAKAGKFATVWLPQTTKTRLRRRLYCAASSDMLVAEPMQETFKLIVNQDVREQAAQLRLPALLLYGSRDNATPVAQGELLAACIPGSRLTVLPGAGHFVHHEQAREVAELIGGFLA